MCVPAAVSHTACVIRRTHTHARTHATHVPSEKREKGGRVRVCTDGQSALVRQPPKKATSEVSRKRGLHRQRPKFKI